MDDELDLDTFMTVLHGVVAEFENAAREGVENEDYPERMTEGDWWEEFLQYIDETDEEEG